METAASFVESEREFALLLLTKIDYVTDVFALPSIYHHLVYYNPRKAHRRKESNGKTC